MITLDPIDLRDAQVAHYLLRATRDLDLADVAQMVAAPLDEVQRAIHSCIEFIGALTEEEIGRSEWAAIETLVQKVLDHGAPTPQDLAWALSEFSCVDPLPPATFASFEQVPADYPALAL